MLVRYCKAGVFKNIARYKLQSNPDQSSDDQDIVEMPNPGQEVRNEVERECQVRKSCSQTEFGNPRGARVSENNVVKPQFSRNRRRNSLEWLEHDL